MCHMCHSATTLGSFGLLYYNGAIITLPALLLFFTSGQYTAFVTTFASLHDPGFLVAFLLSSCMGIVLTYSQINCTQVNDATITSVCGFFKDSFMIVLGLFLFGDVTCVLLLAQSSKLAASLKYRYISCESFFLFLLPLTSSWCGRVIISSLLCVQTAHAGLFLAERSVRVP